MSTWKLVGQCPQHFICNNPKVEITQMIINRWRDKQIVVFHKAEFYSELLIYTIWANLKIIILCERSQTKIKNAYKGFHLYKVLENANVSMMKESRSAVAWGRSEQGNERRIIEGDEETFRGDIQDYFDDSIGIYLFKNLSNCTL